jgi:hypothetical protein
MKKTNIIYSLAAATAVVMCGCSDFEDINKDPSAAGIEQVMPEYFLNQSIIGAQMNPHIQERLFVLTWKYAAHFERASGFALGSNNDEWITDYYGTDFASRWRTAANEAVSIGREKIANNSDVPSTHNVVQMARIWRAYLTAELVSGFGPIATESGMDAEYQSERDVFYFILAELKDAVSQLQDNIDMSSVANFDAMFAGDVAKWRKYGNSLRARYAMQLSVVDNAKAKAEFEDAVKGGASTLITELADMAAVQEVDGWNDLAGVMSRSWNAQVLSPTVNNLVVGLGGQVFPVAASLTDSLKDPQAYLGIYLPDHLPTSTNDPCAGYFFDGIPKTIDPRATKLFGIPGYDDGEVFWSNIGNATTANLLKAEEGSSDVVKVLTTQYSWFTCVAGTWDKKSGYATDLLLTKNFPALAKKYRNSTNKRVWFAPWETYFLLAEAATYSWTTGGTAKDYYEKGIKASFAYHDLTNADAYIASEAYNRVGTSVKFDHTTEAASKSMTHKTIDGTEESVTYTYPVNSIYGNVNNDALSKIITQKYIAFIPYQPFEAWTDHRRLGLPFIENQAVETTYSQAQVPLTPTTAKECKLEFYPKRYCYPSNLETNNAAGYAKALQLLGGDNKSTTPLWWCKK